MTGDCAFRESPFCAAPFGRRPRIFLGWRGPGLLKGLQLCDAAAEFLDFSLV